MSARGAVDRVGFLDLFLGLVASAGTGARADSGTDDGTRRSGDRATEDGARGAPTECAGAGSGLVVALGTDGFGRSDTREALRTLFEIDPPHIAAATMVALARCGALPASAAAKAVKELGIDPGKTDPLAL